MLWRKKALAIETPEPHFVRDYQRLVARLKKALPLDEAMSQSVGGLYDTIGSIEKRILEYAGLKPSMSLVDVGCGSGRLAVTLSDQINYLGTDVVADLLAYAKSRSPRTFRFVRHTELSVPCPDASVDMICAFSVFTHLHHTESFAYVRDMMRALVPGGTLVFSFLEFAEPAHWQIFTDTVAAHQANSLEHLNMFIERSAITAWAERLGFIKLEWIDATAAPQGGEPLHQSVAILHKPR